MLLALAKEPDRMIRDDDAVNARSANHPDHLHSELHTEFRGGLIDRLKRGFPQGSQRVRTVSDAQCTRYAHSDCFGGDDVEFLGVQLPKRSHHDRTLGNGGTE